MVHLTPWVLSKLRLYPPVPVVGQSFAKAKKVVMPNQSMSLREIIRRFMRNESLPVSHEGFYADDMGDLEKMSKEDITIRHERAAAVRASVKKAKGRMDDAAASKAKEEEAARKAAEKAQAPPEPPLPKQPGSQPQA